MTTALRTLGAAVLLLAAGCGIDDLLVGAPCNDDGDCPNLTCVRTASEAASNEPGLCSEDSSCVPGKQEGCVAESDGSCELSLVSVDGGDGNRYCCGSATNPTVVSVSEDGTAECFDCPSCNSNEESCRAGEERCTVEGDAPCGCRLPEGDLINEACGSDEDCGAAVCVRTLEQLEEPDEATIPEQTAEDGNCRPSDDPTCAPGQRGCLAPESTGCLISSDNVVAVGTLEYCCPPPPDSNTFHTLVYAVSADQGQVACTFCERFACDNEAGTPNQEHQCTTVSDPACNVAAGSLCGCPPT